MKEEISRNVVEVRRKSDRVMGIMLTLGGELIRITCAYGPQSGRTDIKKVHFYNEKASQRDLKSSSEMVISLGDFDGHLGKCTWENGIGKRNAEGRRLLEFCDEKRAVRSKHMVL